MKKPWKILFCALVGSTEVLISCFSVAVRESKRLDFLACLHSADFTGPILALNLDHFCHLKIIFLAVVVWFCAFFLADSSAFLFPWSNMKALGFVFWFTSLISTPCCSDMSQDQRGHSMVGHFERNTTWWCYSQGKNPKSMAVGLQDIAASWFGCHETGYSLLIQVKQASQTHMLKCSAVRYLKAQVFWLSSPKHRFSSRFMRTLVFPNIYWRRSGRIQTHPLWQIIAYPDL